MISVCLASHNGEKYIRQQVVSILGQLGPNDELIISDDSSSDNTLNIIKELDDSRIRVLNHNAPIGIPFYLYPTLNFENALKEAKGDYIFLADQDDVWLDNKVQIMMDYLHHYSYVVSDCYVTDEQLNVISDTRFTRESGVTKNKYLAFIKSTPYQGSCAAFRRDVLNKALPFPKDIQSHDRWIGFVAAFYFDVIIIPEKLIYYRRHTGVVSSTTEGKSNDSVLGRIKNRFGYIKGLIYIRKRK